MEELFFLFRRSHRTWDKVRTGWILVFGICIYILIMSEYDNITSLLASLFNEYPERLLYKGIMMFLLSDFMLKFILFRKEPLAQPMYLRTKPLPRSVWTSFSFLYELFHPLNIYFLLFIPFLVHLLNFAGWIGMMGVLWCASLLGSAVCGMTRYLLNSSSTKVYGYLLLVGYLGMLFLGLEWVSLPLELIPAFILASGPFLTFISVRYTSSFPKEDAGNKSEKGFQLSNFSFFRMEMLSILRNRRLRQGVLYAMLFMTGWLYWIAYSMGPEETIKMELLTYLLVFYLFLPGATLAQFIWGAESNFFPLLVTRPFSLFRWIRSKYNFYCILSCGAMLLIAPLFYRTGMDIWDLLSLFLYVAGVNIFLLFPLYFNRVRLTLGKSSLFNYEGFDMISSIYLILVTVGATYFYFFIRRNVDDLWYMLITGIVGILFFSGRNVFFRFLERTVQKKKYGLLEAFRKTR
ncbi:MAG: DUF5687 family protein [Tannerellaceae bacterium]|nr:DUF5687 family protein [Tannerellaceae bacterium]